MAEEGRRVCAGGRMEELLLLEEKTELWLLEDRSV